VFEAALSENNLKDHRHWGITGGEGLHEPGRKWYRTWLVGYARACVCFMSRTVSAFGEPALSKIRSSPNLIPVGTAWARSLVHWPEQTPLFISAARHSLPFVSAVNCFFFFSFGGVCCCLLRSCRCQPAQAADEPFTGRCCGTVWFMRGNRTVQQIWNVPYHV